MEVSPQLRIVPIAAGHWQQPSAADPNWLETLESGRVLYCPTLPFQFESDEQKYLDARYSDPRRKSIYLRADRPGLYGSDVSGSDQEALIALLKRYQISAMNLLGSLFPPYRDKMHFASTSFRPRPTGLGTAALSWRKDDTRLHIDAFPSNPTHGMRILRVFSNVGTSGRVWRVGEPFEQMARYFLPRVPAPRPRLAKLSHALGITKRVRSAYDHYMLHLHDLAKADLRYQRASNQVTFAFPPDSTWICFSDQVMHAAMSGQFMMEQTVHLPLDGLIYREQAPLAVLERLTGRRLL